ncbi:hypothetical protein A3Q56_00380 [Intoshia linei]|uniref:NADH dehydrogenase [ubiquinone] 1 beta subcomplex subunit 11, mitochondrial n=1 Tax=Intoshia linei TaxID=1819745 RepID=A0A177BBY8_9BILA|nr:hypothetical protein A3Q56_00380 [Intoshia linei]
MRILNLCKFGRILPKRCYNNTLQNPGRIKTLLDKNIPPELYKSVVDNPLLENSGKNWISYGFGEDEDSDRRSYHLALFLNITLITVLMAYLTVYLPMQDDHEWIQREAHLRLEYRMKNGLPIIDPNYISVEKILATLPNDEDIDTIII